MNALRALGLNITKAKLTEDTKAKRFYVTETKVTVQEAFRLGSLGLQSAFHSSQALMSKTALDDKKCPGFKLSTWTCLIFAQSTSPSTLRCPESNTLFAPGYLLRSWHVQGLALQAKRSLLLRALRRSGAPSSQ
eukprot:477598-Pyramimonas_sp.AAC.1